MANFTSMDDLVFFYRTRAIKLRGFFSKNIMLESLWSAPDTKDCVALKNTKDIDQAITHLLHCASSVGNLDALPFIPILTSIVWRVMWEESASKAVSV